MMPLSSQFQCTNYVTSAVVCWKPYIVCSKVAFIQIVFNTLYKKHKYSIPEPCTKYVCFPSTWNINLMIYMKFRVIIHDTVSKDSGFCFISIIFGIFEYSVHLGMGRKFYFTLWDYNVPLMHYVRPSVRSLLLIAQYQAMWYNLWWIVKLTNFTIRKLSLITDGVNDINSHRIE